MSTAPGSMPLLQRSGQRWKLLVAGSLFLSGALLLLLLQVSAFHGTCPLVLLGLGAVFGVLGALLATNTVRCPECRLAWVTWGLQHQPASNWLAWLLHVEQCPGCIEHEHGCQS